MDLSIHKLTQVRIPYLAKLILCFWPPERLIPRSPTSVISLSGKTSKSDAKEHASTTVENIMDHIDNYVNYMFKYYCLD